ncbi:hypothetical protein [Streptomyces sp. NPDC001422]|uniref:hypothetical protein n=1 Tax=Streptomyces sp. NPDC001422 TaxID=3364575 RepID=UPI0036982AAE
MPVDKRHVDPHQVGDGLRQRGRRVSQPDGDDGLVVDDVVDGEAAWSRQPLPYATSRSS